MFRRLASCSRGGFDKMVFNTKLFLRGKGRYSDLSYLFLLVQILQVQEHQPTNHLVNIRWATLNIFCGKVQPRFYKFENSARNSWRHHVGWISSKTLKNGFQYFPNNSKGCKKCLKMLVAHMRADMEQLVSLSFQPTECNFSCQDLNFQPYMNISVLFMMF